MHATREPSHAYIPNDPRWLTGHDKGPVGGLGASPSNGPGGHQEPELGRSKHADFQFHCDFEAKLERKQSRLSLYLYPHTYTHAYLELSFKFIRFHAHFSQHFRPVHIGASNFISLLTPYITKFGGIPHIFLEHVSRGISIGILAWSARTDASTT